MTRVFLHGLGQGPDSWAAVRARLSPAPDDAIPGLTALLRQGDGTYGALLTALASALEALPGPLDVLHQRYMNQKNSPPELLAVRRRP